MQPKGENNEYFPHGFSTSIRSLEIGEIADYKFKYFSWSAENSSKVPKHMFQIPWALLQYRRVSEGGNDDSKDKEIS